MHFHLLHWIAEYNDKRYDKSRKRCEEFLKEFEKNGQMTPENCQDLADIYNYHGNSLLYHSKAQLHLLYYMKALEAYMSELKLAEELWVLFYRVLDVDWQATQKISFLILFRPRRGCRRGCLLVLSPSWSSSSPVGWLLSSVLTGILQKIYQTLKTWSQNDWAYEPSLWTSWCCIHQWTHPRSWPMQVYMKLERMPLKSLIVNLVEVG